MSKTRLTNSDRDAIRTAVINHKFDPQQAAHDSTAHALAVKLRAKAYGSYCSTMDAAPEGAFPTTKAVKIAVDGKSLNIPAAGPIRIYHKHYYGERIALLLASDKLGAEATAWAERSEELATERRHLDSVVKGTLSAFNTFDDLIVGWPEAEAFIKARWQTRPEYKANVPAVAIRDLSAALDLPPETQVAA